MRAYLDTSAFIVARRMGLAPDGVTRPHSIAEFFSTLTRTGLTLLKGGVPIRAVISPKDAVAAIQRVFARVEFRELTGEATLASLPRAVKANVQGAHIHDWMHAEAAALAHCHLIVTSNARHFKDVTNLRLVSPEDYFRPAATE